MKHPISWFLYLCLTSSLSLLLRHRFAAPASLVLLVTVVSNTFGSKPKDLSFIMTGPQSMINQFSSASMACALGSASLLSDVNDLRRLFLLLNQNSMKKKSNAWRLILQLDGTRHSQCSREQSYSESHAIISAKLNRKPVATS